MVRCCVTWIEKDINKLEEKEELTPSNEGKIKRLKELAKDYDFDFEQHHVEVLNLIQAKDKAAVDSEEAVFDEHVDGVSEIIKRLEQFEDLVTTIEPVMPHASHKGDRRPGVKLISKAKHLSQRLSQIHDS